MDLVQESMMKLSDKYGDKPKEELPMLFTRILQNTILDYHRRQKVRNTWTTLFSSFQKKDEEDYDVLENLLAQDESQNASAQDEIEQSQNMAAIEEAIAGSPLTTGNQVLLLQDGPATFQAMYTAILAARDHINLETYIFDDDVAGNQFSDLLLERQAAGVQVNVIYDSVGTLTTPAAFFQRLREGGIHLLEFNPVNPLTGARLSSILMPRSSCTMRMSKSG